ncbi:DNA (cytosine-5-)-methyltransferase [Kiloniella antarctica]|uniref:Cytosine-specific methyltransferase n=1 Tax=Kiloniella antarctica TaxID=1550907 RepID=A0ABW5BLC4_9PROT
MSDLNFQELREKNGLSIEEAANVVGVCSKTVRRWENGETTPRPSDLFILEVMIDRKKEKTKTKNVDFTFIDLFAGIGGIRKGFESVGGKCIFTSEWNEYAQKTYKANFPDDHNIVGDITQLEPSDIPVHDVLLAGFPCQPFSLAGVSKKNSLGREHGFMDKAQGTLFFDVLRILKYHRPAAFLLENVKNLKSHNKGDTFETIIGALENELGYKISHQIIDGKGYVPQHRERIFIAGFREDTNFEFKDLSFAAPNKGPVLETILHQVSEATDAHYTISPSNSGSNVNSVVNSKYTLSDKLWNYLKAYRAKHEAKGNGFGYSLNTPNQKARTLSARYHKDGSEILIAQEGKNPRRLTPRECARLMGFDKKNQKPMEIPVSDTRAYQQFGNSVVVPVIEDIARYMKPHIMSLLSIERKKAAE